MSSRRVPRRAWTRDAIVTFLEAMRASDYAEDAEHALAEWR